ncbi:MAG: signal peptidase I [Clostridia bacterium]|nr:signal peptidase I [Clostridia bacterium]
MKKSDNEKKVERSKLKKIINIIEYVVIFLVIFVNAVLIIESVNNPNKTPSFLGRKAFVIISGSMIPEIQIGDVVLVKETENVHVGDIIAFRRDSSVIVHRIVKEMNIKGNVMYQTKGDNNNIEDAELVDVSTIEGVSTGKIPYIGKVLMWLYNHLYIVIVVLIFILIVKYFFF